MMQPLIAHDLYDRFIGLREKLCNDEVGSPAQVFVPVGASTSRSIAQIPRILYVGKATCGFSEPQVPSLECAGARASRVVEEMLLPGRSAFWQFARSILRNLVEQSSEPGKNDILRYFGWSNLAKIGDADSNPDSYSLKEQSKLCQESLEYEIDHFRPGATIISTTNYAEEEILFPLFGRDGWRFNTPDQDQVAFNKHERFGLLVWTNHPQGMRPAGTRAKVQQFVSDLISTDWRNEPLPECVYAASLQTGPRSLDEKRT